MHKIQRTRLTAVAVALSTVFASIQTIAQEVPSGEAEVEKVVVTGSRIARDTNLAAPSPVQEITAETIQASGEFSIADVVNDVPALYSSTSAESSIDSAFADGANVLNLRGLGSNRTLTLVNGRRHVSGVSGSAAVDIGSIPAKLIERVEVLTGGASAVYGADAVTGVVNFILKDDYEGLDIDVFSGISSESDAEQFSISGTYGANFDKDRGNFTVAVEYQRDEGLQVYERDNGLLIGSGRDWANPARRFQQGDISAGSTPNFAEYYSYANTGLTNFGLPIPGQDDFLADYEAAFGNAPALTQTEMDLITRAGDASRFAVLPYRTFPFTSGYGYIIPGNPYTFAGFDPAENIDLDGNGNPDCLDSFTGYNSVFGAASYGVVGGCWNVTEEGTYRPIQDGLVAGDFSGFGGDSFNTLTQNDSYIILPSDKISVNFLGHYDVSKDMTVFGELKYVLQETENESQPTSYWDLLFGATDNPYLPEFIQPVADAVGGVAITVDPIGIGNGRVKNERETIRGVLGVEGFFANNWEYEFSVNYGKFTRESKGDENLVVVDRFFSAIDAVTDPATGEATCRVNLDASTPQVATPFDIPSYDPGYFSFTPGDGSCVPLNIWAGAPGISQAAVDWILKDSYTEIELEQLVISGSVTGDTSDWFELPYGPILFAFGGEYREEKSSATFDDWQLGILPSSTQFTSGALVSEFSGNESLVFQPSIKTANEVGKFDVAEAFFEASIPLVYGENLAEELTVDIAARFSDYSTVGDTFTWKTNLVYAPIEELRFRLSVSQAVRAPNVTELFGPEVGTTFRPIDPCDVGNIDALRESNPDRAANIQANCVTDLAAVGYDALDENGNYDYSDPLSAAFPGITGGNPELKEETADTTTLGFVYSSSVLEGFSASIDYWEIKIEDAISSVSSDDIVNGCYIGESLNANFCDLFERNSNSDSPQHGGFTFLRSTEVNFARIETSGYDFQARYDFNIEAHEFSVKVSGTKVNEIDQYTNPNDLNEVDRELGEVNRPEWGGNIFVDWRYESFSIGWQTQYIGEQLLGFVEIEEYEDGLFDSSVMMDEFFQHDLSFGYDINDDMGIYGGIKNVTDEQPFITAYAYPASPRGRFFFLGFNYKAF